MSESIPRNAWPPLFDGFGNGYVNWRPIGDVDVTLLGHMLFCHLIIEHYIEQYLKVEIGEKFSIESARLTFGQKLSLLNAQKLKSFDFRPAVKHLNVLRNRLVHRISNGLNDEDLLPLRVFLKATNETREEVQSISNLEAKELLSRFAGVVCSWFAACITVRCPGTGIDDRKDFEWWVFAADPSMVKRQAEMAQSTGLPEQVPDEEQSGKSKGAG